MGQQHAFEKDVGERPVGSIEGPSTELTADKTAFGTERIRRWFGREWAPAHS